MQYCFNKQLAGAVRKQHTYTCSQPIARHKQATSQGLNATQSDKACDGWRLGQSVLCPMLTIPSCVDDRRGVSGQGFFSRLLQPCHGLRICYHLLPLLLLLLFLRPCSTDQCTGVIVVLLLLLLPRSIQTPHHIEYFLHKIRPARSVNNTAI